MLERTFCHLPGIGLRKERRLWESGICCWEDARRLNLPGWTEGRRLLGQSRCALEGGQMRYFYDRLPADQHWRLFPLVRNSMAYLDIETTGMGPDAAITTVALYDGHAIRWYVKDRDLGEFARDITAYRAVVTYNGKCFDAPVIRSVLGVEVPHMHFDLRYILGSLGYRGGLKGCEREMGFSRAGLDGVDGYFAVLLWEAFVAGRDERALRTLLAYNVQDVLGLEHLMVRAYNRKLASIPFGGPYRLPVPRVPSNPLEPDRALLARVRQMMNPATRH